MIAKTFLALLPLLAGVWADDDARALGVYNYDRCDEEHGPSMWPGSCSNHVLGGTPIDLCGAVPFTQPNPVITTMGYDADIPMDINIGGASLKVTVTGNRPTLTADNLAFRVMRSQVDDTPTWALEQMHLHWGRTGMTREGSEHFLQGQSFAAEGHFVHYNTKYNTFTGAVQSGATDALLVVGVFMTYSGNPGTDVNAISRILEQVNNGLQLSDTPVSVGNLNFADIFATTGTTRFYSYGGGLTTPECNEIVTWIVMEQPVGISQTALDALWALPIAEGEAETVGEYGNYRPLQDIMTRTVYRADGASAPCATVVEPDFECQAAPAPAPNGSVATLPSLALPLALMLAAMTKLL